MSPPKNTKAPAPAAPEADTPPAAPQRELPIVHALGIVKVAGGWSVVELFTQGDRIIERNVLHKPDVKGIAMAQLRKHVILMSDAPLAREN